MCIRDRLNTLRNLDSLVQMASTKNYQEPFDYITIALGTNDCKAIFAADFETDKKNYQTLLDKLQSSKLYAPPKTKIILMTPPPIDAVSYTHLDVYKRQVYDYQTIIGKGAPHVVNDNEVSTASNGPFILLSSGQRYDLQQRKVVRENRRNTAAPNR